MMWLFGSEHVISTAPVANDFVVRRCSCCSVDIRRMHEDILTCCYRQTTFVEYPKIFFKFLDDFTDCTDFHLLEIFFIIELV